MVAKEGPMGERATMVMEGAGTAGTEAAATEAAATEAAATEAALGAMAFWAAMILTAEMARAATGSAIVAAKRTRAVQAASRSATGA